MISDDLKLYLITILILFLLYRLPWAHRYPVFGLFIVLSGLTNTWISHILVIKGYLSFPLRPFASWTMNNIVYDWIVFPGLLLTTLDFMERKKLPPWILSILFALFVTVLDGLVIAYTNLLIFNKWTLTYTFVASIPSFWLGYAVYHWLLRYYDRGIQKEGSI